MRDELYASTLGGVLRVTPPDYLPSAMFHTTKLMPIDRRVPAINEYLVGFLKELVMCLLSDVVWG